MCLLYLMKSRKLNFVTCSIFLIISDLYVPVIANRIILRPMSASEVYRVLREAGRENVVPEGRVVNQGLSALTGFTLGLAKGIGGTLLVSLAMSGLNSTSFGSWFGSSSSNSSSTDVKTQEICFSTRSANEINDSVERSIGKIRQVKILKGGKEDDSYKTNLEEKKLENGRATTPATSPTTNNPTSPGPPPTSPVTSTPTSPGATPTTPTTNTPTSPGATPTSPTTSAPTGTITSPISTPTSSTIPSTGNNGTNTGTNTATTTNTGDESAINCIVIQKQQRKRRSVRWK